MSEGQIVSLPTRIDTARLRIRPFRLDDVAPFTRFMTDRLATRFMAFGDEDKTAEGARRIITTTIASYDSKQPMFALAAEERASDEFVGACGLAPREGGLAEIFYSLLPENWGRGFGTEMAKGLLDYVVSFSALSRIEAMIVPAHRHSIRIAEKLGFVRGPLVERPGFREPIYQYLLELDRARDAIRSDRGSAAP